MGAEEALVMMTHVISQGFLRSHFASSYLQEFVKRLVNTHRPLGSFLLSRSSNQSSIVLTLTSTQNSTEAIWHEVKIVTKNTQE